MESIRKAIDETIELVQKEDFKSAEGKLHLFFGDVRKELKILHELEDKLKNFLVAIEKSSAGLKVANTQTLHHEQFSIEELETLKKVEVITANLMTARDKHLIPLAKLLQKAFELLISEKDVKK